MYISNNSSDGVATALPFMYPQKQFIDRNVGPAGQYPPAATLTPMRISLFCTVAGDPVRLFGKQPLQQGSSSITSGNACDDVVRKLNPKLSECGFEGVNVLRSSIMSHSRVLGLPRVDSVLGNVAGGKGIGGGQ